MEWLRAVEIYHAVVRAGSLSEAARRMGYSPASISRHISDLEQSLGARLLNRTSRRLSMTEAGDIYFQRTLAIVHEIGDAKAAVTNLSSAPRGLLRIHSRMVVGHQLVVPSLKRFLKIYPEISIDLQLSNYAVDIVAQGIDIDIRMGSMENSSLVARKLAPSERLLCASPEYLAAHPPIETPLDLLVHSCLTYRITDGEAVWRFRRSGDPDIELRVGGAFKSESGQAIFQATCDGLGISIMNDWTVRQDLASGRLVRVLPDYEVTFSEFENGVYAVFQKSAHLPPKIRAFVDFLSKEFRKLNVGASAPVASAK
ncbi:LysR family transcriptional regulator [Devosia alba]|uniref:LysR family transcriptional regulator n=1 Tax=Devosia alba TaxID=3152360 RepID=UPI003267E5D4